MVFWVDPSTVDATTDEERDKRLQELIRQRSGLNLEIVTVERSIAPEGDLHAFIVYARP
jgi:hypothetical protein